MDGELVFYCYFKIRLQESLHNCLTSWIIRGGPSPHPTIFRCTVGRTWGEFHPSPIRPLRIFLFTGT